MELIFPRVVEDPCLCPACAQGALSMIRASGLLKIHPEQHLGIHSVRCCVCLYCPA